MEFTVTTMSHDTYVYAIKGEIDLYTVQALREDINRILENRAADFVFDLKAVEYLDSSGIGVFISLFTKLRKTGNALVLVGVRQQVKQVLEYTSLTRLLPIEGSTDGALGYLEGRRTRTDSNQHGNDKPV